MKYQIVEVKGNNRVLYKIRVKVKFLWWSYWHTLSYRGDDSDAIWWTIQEAVAAIDYHKIHGELPGEERITVIKTID